MVEEFWTKIEKIIFCVILIFFYRGDVMQLRNDKKCPNLIPNDREVEKDRIQVIRVEKNSDLT